jgi:hypothetical protein
VVSQTRRIGNGFCGCYLGVAGGLARGLPPVLGSLVANQSEDSADNVGHNKLIRLCVNEPATCFTDISQEGIDIVPFGLGYDLEQDVCGSYGAGFRSPNLSPLEKAGQRLALKKLNPRDCVMATHDINFSTDASNGWPC